MSKGPLVSVVLSVFNGEKYLEVAIESILNQSFRDFEFVIINDGSIDGTAQILQRYAESDARIRLYHQENRGLIASLNRGCHLAKGEYIARMDADDISLPTRFEKQVRYMERHPEIGVLGTWVKTIDKDGVPQSCWHPPISSSIVEWALLFRDCVAHPSVIMRRDVISQLDFYRLEALHVEDYDLWIRATIVTQIANLPEILYLYRSWEGNICSKFSRIQEKNIIEIIMPQMMQRLLNHEVPMETLVALRQISMDSPIKERPQTKIVGRLIRELHHAYLRKKNLSNIEIKRISQDAGERLYTLASFAFKFSIWEGFMLYFHALRLNPRLLSPEVLKKFLKRFTHNPFGASK